ncbi:DNA helicase RecQ [Thiolinea disciformis]|uniref:DNA helicase RecQ n=1 Tax=Thiolinea disciformis TaxID=125614 RepID=UPI0003712057|nr:DNA helicase RecQ [Thiolinea disciformis]
MKRAQQILKTIYGYDEFRLNQQSIIESVLAGRDVLALMPTGGGKSLCYQIPALTLKGVGVVISPLIALMQDQVDALKQLGIRAAFINSSLTMEEWQATERHLLAGELDLVYVAPERLVTARMLNLLTLVHANHGLALFAIDEAHCVSQWGHDFRPEYQQLAILAERFEGVPRLALTATADLRTRQEIIDHLALQDPVVFINSFDRPNIRYQIQETEQSSARQQLWRFIQIHHADDAGIVYCLSRKKVEEIANWLSEQGRIALPYHAGLPAELRRYHQERFLREDGIIIVATIAFGMGIDKPDVRFVAHLNLPKSIEAYYQETGRAGRDGEAANAWMAYGLQDAITLRRMSDESTASVQHKRVEHHKLEALLGLCEMSSCRRQALLSYFGEEGSEPCGNCDNCLNPPETWEASEAARKALSCVYRTGQRFGVNYVIEVLIGKDDERIKANRHDSVSTFGIGKELSVAQWRSLFRQLIALGYLDSDIEYGALKLSEKARPLLRGEERLSLRRERKISKEKHKAVKPSLMKIADETLWELLREVRLLLAREQNVPPYVILSNKVLANLLEERPQTLAQMAQISGIGQQKLARYGKAFLDVLRRT